MKFSTLKDKKSDEYLIRRQTKNLISVSGRDMEIVTVI